MPAGADQEERTESATPRRREEARKKGQVAQSTELTSTFMFLIGLSALRIVFPSIFSDIKNITENSFSHISPNDILLGNISNYGEGILVSFIKIFMPFSIIMIVSAIAINYVQVGFAFSSEALTPKFDRIDPVKGFTRLISRRMLISFIQSLLKLIIVAYVLYITVRNEKSAILVLGDMEIKPAIAEIIRLTFKMSFRSIILLFAIAVFDYVYQRWEYEKSLRMTKQEVKEEMKSAEGDPLIKSRIRSIQREMAMRRMMQAVPEADVVITNPTHLAIALKYAKDIDFAPKVCAKGKNLIAERIKAIARENNVPIIEDKPLAQALYKLDLDQEIPSMLYKAVAEILAEIYQKNKVMNF